MEEKIKFYTQNLVVFTTYQNYSANIEFACRIWGLRCTDLNQGFVYGISTKEIDLDYENLATSFHYDSILEQY